MKIDTFFILNMCLLAALIAGATYLQNTYDTDKTQSVPVAAQSSAGVANTSSGWAVSSTTAAVNVPAASTGVPATKPAARVSAPIRRVYNDERDDDN